MEKLELPKNLFDQDKQTEEPKESVSPLHMSVLKMSYELVKMSVELADLRREIQTLRDEIAKIKDDDFVQDSCLQHIGKLLNDVYGCYDKNNEERIPPYITEDGEVLPF